VFLRNTISLRDCSLPKSYRMKKLSIFWKLLLSIFLVSALSIVSFGVLFYFSQKKALIDRTIDQLRSVNILKKEMVQKRLEEDEKFLWHFIRKVMLSTNGRHESPEIEFLRHKDFLKDFCKDYGHWDVLLLDKNQEVVDQLYEDDAFSPNRDTLKYSFIRVFLIDDSEYRIALITGTLYIEKLLFERTGMGNTGESYMVDEAGRLVTKSRFFPNTPPTEIMAYKQTVEDAFSKGADAALTKDYRNVDVLSAFDTIRHNGITWAIISEMDFVEAMQTVAKLRTSIVYLGVMCLFVALFVTLYLSQSISRPVRLVSRGIDSISKGIIPEPMKPPFYPNEKGQMKMALNRLIDSFNKITAFASEIGRGNLNADFEPLSEHDELGKSLLEMRKQLNDFRLNEEMLNKRKALFLLEGQENERKRVARDLHDGLGQWLTGLKLKIAAADIPTDQKNELKEITSETIEEVRRITNNLMPSVLVDFGIDAALRQIKSYFQKTSQVQIQYTYQKEDASIILPFEVSVTLYRIAQEALNNTIKHSEATLVKMVLVEKQHEISLSIEDNGKGFTTDKIKREGNGLKNMEERVNLLNGSFFIKSQNEGTKLLISIPLDVS